MRNLKRFFWSLHKPSALFIKQSNFSPVYAILFLFSVSNNISYTPHKRRPTQAELQILYPLENAHKDTSLKRQSESQVRQIFSNACIS